jgi:dipeptidyl aminopeptidase/acylaminoacyl peptidase
MKNFDWKRIALIIGFIFFVFLFGYLLYRFFFAPAPPPAPPTPPTPPSPAPIGLRPGEKRAVPPLVKEEKPLPGPNEATITPIGEVLPPAAIPPEEFRQETARDPLNNAIPVTRIQEDRNINPRIANDGKSIITFDSYTGEFLRIQPDGTPEKMTDKTFVGAEKITWSPQGDKVAMKFIDLSTVVYDFKKQKQYVLPEHWNELTFSPDGEQIAFKSIPKAPENRWVVLTNPDGSGPKLIAPMSDRNGTFEVSWSPSDQIVAYYRKAEDQDRQKIYFVGKNDENFKSMIVNGQEIVSQWSPDGNRFLYSGYTLDSALKPELWIVDALGDSIGSNQRFLGVQTWADKCTFANATILYCAVPKELVRGAGIIRTVGDTAEDEIYKINTASGYKERIATFDTKHTIEKLILSQDQSILYFTDKETGAIFQVQLYQRPQI